MRRHAGQCTWTSAFYISRESKTTRNVLWSRASVCLCVCVCLSVCLSAAACPHYCTDPDVTWGSGGGCPLVVHYWADLQSVHGMRCYERGTEAARALFGRLCSSTVAHLGNCWALVILKTCGWRKLDIWLKLWHWSNFLMPYLWKRLAHAKHHGQHHTGFEHWTSHLHLHSSRSQTAKPRRHILQVRWWHLCIVISAANVSTRAAEIDNIATRAIGGE